MERRSSERVKSVFPIIANYKKSTYRASLVGETVNMSDGGACLVVDSPLPIDSEIQLRIKIPLDYSFVIPDKIGNLEADAKIVWIDQYREANRYRCGIKFLDTENQSISDLKEILRTEEENLTKRNWDVSHPKIIRPTLPLSHSLLESLYPSSLSVDITNLCNLRCKHCFWNTYDTHLPTGTNENILEQVKIALNKFPNITNITWYGGEPLISGKTRTLLEEGIKLKKNNLIISNGTIPIPDWHDNIHYAISIDGTEDINSKIRGTGLYEKIKKNIRSALNRDIPINILYCINSINFECIPKFIEEWERVGFIKIVFTVYVPIVDKPSLLSLTDQQRDKVVSILLSMKKKYGELIYNSELMIELIRAKYGRELADNCPMNVFNKRGNTFCLHMCNDGSIRVPCAIGPDADHLQCRSVTKLALYAGMILKDKASFVALLRMYHSKAQKKEKITVLSIGE